MMLAYLALLASTALGLTVRQSSDAPTAKVKNGTYAGLHQETYNQDLFLGIPFAQPPLGDLRFRLPLSFNETWAGSRNATAYYPLCVGYGGDDIGYDVAEDCLALNVVRPSGHEGERLPVAVWIHGGAYVMGGTADRRYNLSFIVQNSVEIDKPIIAVSVAYRLSAWGFLDSAEVRDAGATNIGMHDQRLALQWLQENIEAFGGDPSKVTIWGESAGALSVGIHLTAYGGRDDGLFRGAICESGGSLLFSVPNYNVSDGQAKYDNISAAAGCKDSNDTLACLRKADFKTLNAAINITEAYDFFPYQDGDLIRAPGSENLKNGSFVKVPLIIGANTDEGADFGPGQLDNDTAFAEYLAASPRIFKLNDSVVSTFEAVYPNIPASLDVLTGLSLSYQFNSTYGIDYRRGVAFGGDYMFIAGRRLQCQSWSQHNVSAYCYRFNVVPNGNTPFQGASHFMEVAFVFNNLNGLGYAKNPFQGQPQTYRNVSELMSKMWASFVHDGNPNGHGLHGYKDWPAYDIVKGGGVGMDYLFDANTTSRPEVDNWRAEGIAYLNSMWGLYGK